MSEKFSSESISGEESLYYELGYRYYSYTKKRTLKIGYYHLTLFTLLLYINFWMSRNYLFPLFLLFIMLLGFLVLNIQLSERIYYSFFLGIVVSIGISELKNESFLGHSQNPIDNPWTTIVYSLLLMNLVLMLMYDSFTLQSVKSQRVLTPATEVSRKSFSNFKQRLSGTSFSIDQPSGESFVLNKKYLYLQFQTMVFFITIIFIANSLQWDIFQWFYAPGNLRESYYLGSLTLIEFAIILWILIQLFGKKVKTSGE